MSLISKEHLRMAFQSATKLFDKKIKDSTADWSQNDSSADNYVKNRTHWEEEQLLSETRTLNGTGTIWVSLEDEEFAALLRDNKESATYFIDYEDMGEVEYVFIEGSYNSKYDRWQVYNYENLNSKYTDVSISDGVLYFEDAGGSYVINSVTVTIKYKKTITHKLDPKYIPDMQANWNQTDPNAKDYIKNRPFGYSSYTTLVDENITIINGRADLQSQLGYLIRDEKFILTFDGIEYTGTVWEDGDACYRTDFTTSDGVSVSIYDLNGIVTSSELDGDHTIKIVVERDGYNQIKLSDIPESIQRTADAVGRKGTGIGAEEFNVSDGNSIYRASGDYSTARGYYTIAKGDYSTVSGKYNLEDVLYEDIIDTNITSLKTRNTWYIYYSDVEPQLDVTTGFYDVSNFSKVKGSYLIGKYPIYIVDERIIYDSKSADHYYFKSDDSYSSRSYGSEIHYEFNNLVYHKIESHVAHKYAHIVGNGSGYFNTERSNAHTLDWNGVGWFAGGVKVGGKHQDDTDAVDVVLSPDVQDVVRFSNQSLTDEQKLQIKKNVDSYWYEPITKEYTFVPDSTNKVFTFEDIPDFIDSVNFVYSYHPASILTTQYIWKSDTHLEIIYTFKWDDVIRQCTSICEFDYDSRTAVFKYAQGPGYALVSQNFTLTLSGYRVSYVDEKCIPRSIARVSDIPTEEDVIPVPEIAEVGQVLAVKTVNENGKPTEWEAVDTQPDWNQNDETAPDFIKNKPDVVLRSEIEEIDAIELVTETGLVSPAAAEDGSIYTDENGALYSL